VTAPRTGIWLFPDAPGPVFVEAIVAAEDTGIGEIWVGDEGPARDPIGLLCAAAVRTSSVLLAVGVTNPYLRHPALTASAMATVHELSHGRAILGLGPGGRLALDPVGLRPARPLADCRRALPIIRAVLAGAPVEGYLPPPQAFRAPDLPVFVGARGERFNRWASADADGVFLAGIAPALLDQAVGWARSSRPVRIALYVSACLDLDELERVRPRMIHAFADAPPTLRTQAGLSDDDVSDAAEAFGAGDGAPAARLLSDHVLDLVLVRGHADAVARCAALARAHNPESIGLVVLGSDPRGQVERAAAVLADVRKELA
jgi:5,10-methylenetetrahydromethanopterin reductase